MAEPLSYFRQSEPGSTPKATLPLQQAPFEQSRIDYQVTSLLSSVTAMQSLLESIDEKVNKRLGVHFTKIHFLVTKRLRTPLEIILEPDDEGFTARAVELPIYGSGDYPEDAVTMLKREIESLYQDLMEDDDFTAEWLPIKAFLAEIVSE